MPGPRISFEYFPPKTVEGRAKLLDETTPALNALGPAFFSVTYGAGGTTRDTTLGIVTALKEQGIDVISFGIGDPDIPTPDPVLDRLESALRTPAHHRYPESEGLPEFRQAVCDFYSRRFGVELDPATEAINLIGLQIPFFPCAGIFGKNLKCRALERRRPIECFFQPSGNRKMRSEKAWEDRDVWRCSRPCVSPRPPTDSTAIRTSSPAACASAS